VCGYGATRGCGADEQRTMMLLVVAAVLIMLPTAAAPAAAAAAAAAAAEPRSTVVYMLTPDVVDATNTTMVRQIGRPAKDEKPVITLDRPWEYALYLCGHSVIKVDNQLFLYYTNVLPFPRVSHGALLLLAISSDEGKTWTKPELNLVSYDGSTANNIVIAGIVNGGNAFVDPAARADERYKFVGTVMGAPLTLVLWSSADGKKWTKRGALAGTWPRAGDTQPTMMYDTKSARYLMYGRVDGELPGKQSSVLQGDVGRHPVRKVGFSETANLTVLPGNGTWTKVSLALGFPPAGHSKVAPSTVDTYNSAAVAVHNAFLLVPSQFLQAGSATFPVSHALTTDGVLDARLAVSGNCAAPFDWLDDVFIERGVGEINTSATNTSWHFSGDWDAGLIFSVRGYHSSRTRTIIFYMGSQVTHGSYPEIYAYKNATIAIGRATMRLDGWFSFDAPANEEATLLTTPLLTPNATSISVFVNVLTSVRGYLRCEVLDAATLVPLSGFSFNESVPLMGNYVRRRLSWNSNASLPAGVKVRLRFAAFAGKLFTLGFESSSGNAG
jgi:hypothetical protein